ncbi:hypothetical protein AAKU64_000169 [Undibacterium sp. GrIS 1.8]|uniref:hypothetical protein n=1 Tax=Undibacterium sp. GrIS 1.8 TaxID=3143934 RepID=UPI00339ACD48
MKSIAKRIIHTFVVGITTVALCMPMLETANASAVSSGARSSGGSSRSFKSGFSSQRSTNANGNNSNGKSSLPASDDRNSGKTNTGFGSFSSSPSNTVTANVTNAATNNTVNNNAGKSNSALNRDLDSSRSQNTALKNLDARTSTSAANANNQPASVSVTGKPLGASSNTFGNSAQGSIAQGSISAPAYGQPMQQAPSTIIVQRESSGMGGAFWGFMLGQSMSHHNYGGGYGGNYGPGYDNRPRDAGSTNGSTTDNASNTSNGGNATPQVSTNNKVQESESWFWRLLRLMLWTAILSGIAWVGYKLLQFHKARNQARTQASTQNYSLGKV